MGIAFVAAVAMADSFPTLTNGGRRFLLLSLPLLPLVLFRVEPWLILWVVASLGFAFGSSWGRSSIAAAIAAMTKGWPLILLTIPFRLGRRQLAATVAVLTVLALAFVALLPGFREGRAFEGIHTETIIGNLVLVYRDVFGSDLQLIGVAGAEYVSVGQWAVALNMLIGLPLLAVAIRNVLRQDTVVELIPSIGLGVLGIILASPLFSSQFLFWLVPFVLFLVAGRQLTFTVIAVMTLLTIVLWNPWTAGWNLLVLARNALLLLFAVMWALDAVSHPPDSAEDSLLEDIA